MTKNRQLMSFRGNARLSFDDVLRYCESPWDRTDTTVFLYHTSRRQYNRHTSFEVQPGQRLDIDYWEGRCIIQEDHAELAGDNTATPDEQKEQLQESPSDDHSFVQLSLLSQTELEEHRLPYDEPRYGVLMINRAIAAENDILRAYLHATSGVVQGPVWSIHTWMLKMGSKMLAFARVCILQQRVHFTKSLIQIWADVVEDESFGVTVSDPTGTSLSLRVQPVDLIGIPMMALRAGFRAFLLV